MEALIEARDQSIGINLERILRNPRGADDLILEEGDILDTTGTADRQA
jgi:hypothetical protein